ncbi:MULTISPECIES: hypothetical protein [unclassified Rathayibacter]|uniref:hypothetical protein n=1 Tax=unclassified Rathayibacter TaxID=2609250 RepID=UPI00104A8E45|nr:MULTISPECIES: hypothetical protein [unclassified Rathayibacter]TCL86056.1 hypothetical protein EDF49_101725 [Rathayibacter sp. PhB192]TCM31877.1 hypothetical protein EDF43_101725 [Rathayibacter sp. PhB179]
MDARRRLLVGAGAVALVLVAGALVLDATAGGPGGGPGGGSPISAGATGSAGTPSPGAPSSSPGAPATPGATSAATVNPPDPSNPAAVADPSAPLEVSGPAPVDTGLPDSTPRAALVSLPLPAAASATRALVAGYPSAVVAPLPDSIVASSSVEPAGDALRSGLTATVALDAEQIVESYRRSLAAQGFTSAAVDAPADGAAMVFTAGEDNVSLSVTPTGTPRMSYSLIAVLHPNGG